MNAFLSSLLIVIVAYAATTNAQTPPTGTPCSAAWNRSVDEQLSTGDGAGHGPDLGSEEWKSVVEFKLGIRGNSDVPARDTKAWCDFIDERVRGGGGGLAGTGKDLVEAGPSFSCEKVEPGSIEAMICADKELSAQDRKLSSVYAAAAAKAVNEHPPVLTAEQRGWIKGRNECWKSDDKRACVQGEYEHRIAELQARYRLVASRGPVRWFCDGTPTNEVVVTYFQTEPPTLVAERGDSVSVMFLQPSGSGTKYQGRNESLWEHQGEATVVWGFEAPEMRCKLAAAGEKETHP